MKQNQAHGKPNRANPPTDSKKKNTNTKNQKSNPRSHPGRESKENQTPIQSTEQKQNKPTQR